jgi:hypothetical protein
MWRWSGHSRLPSFLRIHSYLQSCYYVIRIFHVRLNFSFMCVVRALLQFHSWRLEFSQIKFHSFQVYRARVTRPWDSSSSSIGASHLYIRHYGVPSRGIQPPTLHVNLFAIYHYIFITLRSSYNVLSYHTMLAGATWGIKCDKQALLEHW